MGENETAATTAKPSANFRMRISCTHDRAT
jgi:hypothetical protein